MWFIFALLTMLMWGTADLFYKKGADDTERFSHLKTSIMVGLVMGTHAIFTLLFTDIGYNFRNLYIYLPVSAMYILSMTVGYFGLRYLELSISSPIQNSSGVVVMVLCFLILGQSIEGIPNWIAMILISGGVLALGFLEKQQSDRQLITSGERKYRIGFVAFFMPIAYCVIDALGTFLDAYYLDDFSTTPLVGVTEENFEDVANISYELTFLIVAVLLFVYVRLIKHEKIVPTMQGARLGAAIFETAGQFTYVRAMSGNGIIAAPMIAAYSIVSIILSRVFLKEKLPLKQYIAVGGIIIGIIILGIMEGIAE